MNGFREVPPQAQSLYPTLASTSEALHNARDLMPDVPHNSFMQAMMVYHNTLLKVIEEESA